MKLLAVSGSLRAGSSNNRLLEAVRLLAPGEAAVAIHPPLDRLPFFNPDVEERGLPPIVAEWRSAVGACDALIISSPEYAHGVPGVLKNALDWLVGGMEMAEKPVALLNATPPAEYAQNSLMETLGVMGGRFVEAASFETPLRGDTRDAADIAADPVIAAKIKRMIEVLGRYVG
jgi:chromate reductase